MRIPAWMIAACGSIAMQGVGAAFVGRLPPPVSKPSWVMCDCIAPPFVRNSGLIVLRHGADQYFLPPEPRAARCEDASQVDDEAPSPLAVPSPRVLPAEEVIACASFDIDGRVSAAWIIRGSKATRDDRLALSTLRAIPFLPAHLTGRAVASRHVVIVGPANWSGLVY
jgi:hypothetical protein